MEDIRFFPACSIPEENKAKHKEELQKAINTKEEFPEIEDARRLLEELS